MSEELTKFEFKLYRLSPKEKNTLLNKLKKELMSIEDIVFAYIHGSFIELNEFRDIDVAIWIKDSKKAFHYTIELSTKLEIKLKTPIDIHVLNEAPLPFKYHVFSKGILLLSKDENFRWRKVDEVVRKYLDLKQLEKHAIKQNKIKQKN